MRHDTTVGGQLQAGPLQSRSLRDIRARGARRLGLGCALAAMRRVRLSTRVFECAGGDC
jgi:hypothetical protein